MAVCDVCKREMNRAKSCDADARARECPLESDGVTYAPLAFGDDRMMNPTTSGWSGGCPDCRVRIGGVHHPGCDREECPKCHGQLLSCGCFDQDDDDDPA